MSTSLKNFVFIVFFFASSCLFGMDPHVKIQTSDAEEFEIALGVAQQSETIKKMIEDIGEQAGGELPIPLPHVTKEQFELLLPVLQKLAKLPMAKEEKKRAQQLQQIVAELKSNNQRLNNQQLVELVAGANFLNIPVLEPALKALALRKLNKEEWAQLESLGDTLKGLWHAHYAKKVMLEGSSLQHLFQHLKVDGVIASLDSKYLISWSREEGTIIIWDINSVAPRIKTLEHQNVSGVIESSDGKNLISWGGGTIKIWDKTNLATKPTITLEHPKVKGVIKSKDGKNLISWSFSTGTIKVWDKAKHYADPITLKHPGVNSVILKSDGNLISYGQGTLITWDATTNLAEDIRLKHMDFLDVIESKDGENLISWSYKEGTIKIWDKNNLQEELITLQHPGVSNVIESPDGKKLISWSLSFGKGTIRIWHKNNLAAPITLKHSGVGGAIESLDSKYLISWGNSAIKIWDENNLTAEPTILQHPNVIGVIESSDGKNLISWSKKESTIKVWDEALLNPTSEQTLLLLAVYFVSKGNQVFDLTPAKLSELKTTFNMLSPITQAFLERQAPQFIATIKSAQK